MILIRNITRNFLIGAVKRNRRTNVGNIYYERIRLLNTNDCGRVITSPFPDVEQPTGNFVNTLFENVSRWGSKTAIQCSATGRSYTYNHLLDGISRWAGFLASKGMQKGDVIAVYMPNCPEFPLVQLGAISIGLVVSPHNPRYTKYEFATHINDCNPKLVVVTPSLADVMKDLANTKGLSLLIVTNGPSSVKGTFNLRDILNDPEVPYSDIVQVAEGDTAMLPYSSGTTGPPKGVEVSHGGVAINTEMCTQPPIFAAKTCTDSYQEMFLGLMPLFHGYGMLLMFHAIKTGAKILTIDSFNPQTFVDILKKNPKLEILHLVPPIVNFLLQSPAVTPEILPNLRTLVVSAIPLSPSAAEAFKDKFRRDIFIQEVFGMTEILFSTAVPLNEERFGSCGKLMPNVSAKVVSAITGEILSPTETGEICYKTPSMMKGYLKNERATSEVIDEDGFLHSGDIGSFDADGFLKISDRKKELIKVKGLQVSPAELEDVIRLHPKVADVGVVGIPHERFIEVPKAIIVAKNNDIIDEQDIHRFLEGRVAPHKMLVGGIAFASELPRTPAGKLLRRELKKM